MLQTDDPYTASPPLSRDELLIAVTARRAQYHQGRV